MAELTPMKLSTLKQRALDSGMASPEVEGVDDSDDPKAAIIELLRAALLVELEANRTGPEEVPPSPGRVCH